VPNLPKKPLPDSCQNSNNKKQQDAKKPFLDLPFSRIKREKDKWEKLVGEQVGTSARPCRAVIECAHKSIIL
jgi:hypothetical protein